MLSGMAFKPLSKTFASKYFQVYFDLKQKEFSPKKKENETLTLVGVTTVHGELRKNPKLKVKWIWCNLTFPWSEQASVASTGALTLMANEILP